MMVINEPVTTGGKSFFSLEKNSGNQENKDSGGDDCPVHVSDSQLTPD